MPTVAYLKPIIQVITAIWYTLTSLAALLKRRWLLVAVILTAILGGGVYWYTASRYPADAVALTVVAVFFPLLLIVGCWIYGGFSDLTSSPPSDGASDRFC